jgi:LytS/YehU family sensor histidine kinase
MQNLLPHLLIPEYQERRDNRRTPNLFNEKLAQVYKYFLLNKDKELIPVHDEIDFIKDYIFLVQLRHDERIQLQLNFVEENINNILIIPCALQILVENVIKHNEFTNHQPLRILMSIDGEYLSIENQVKLKQGVDSTQIGLKNLDAQYLLLCNKNIVVEENGSRFIVKLPLIKNAKKELHDKYSYYRRREIIAGETIANIRRSVT